MSQVIHGQLQIALGNLTCLGGTVPTSLLLIGLVVTTNCGATAALQQTTSPLIIYSSFCKDLRDLVVYVFVCNSSGSTLD